MARTRVRLLGGPKLFSSPMNQALESATDNWLNTQMTKMSKSGKESRVFAASTKNSSVAPIMSSLCLLKCS